MLNAVIIDSREPQWIQELTFGNAPTSVQVLDQGDLLVACDDTLLCIERKTPDDLLSSIQDGRLLTQAAHLTDQTPWAYLIITGALLCSSQGKVITQRGETGWSWNSVQGALLSVQELGVFVIQTGSERDYEHAVVGLAKRPHESMPLPPARRPRFLSPGEEIIASLPGIGLERLNAVLELTKTPAEALAWLTWIGDKDHVPGVGYQTCQNVRKVLGLDDHEMMIVTTIPPIVTVREASDVSASN